MPKRSLLTRDVREIQPDSEPLRQRHPLMHHHHDRGVLGSVQTPHADDAMDSNEVSTVVDSEATDGPKVMAGIG